MSHKRFNLEVIPCGPGKWDVMAGGDLRGQVERAVINVHGHGPEYLAHYYVGREPKTYPSVFHGEMGMLAAVAMILDKAR